MRYWMMILLFCFSAASMAEQHADPNQQLVDLIFNDPDSPRKGAKNPRLTIVSFTDYNCPWCKKFDPMLEKIVHDNPDVQLIVKLLPFRGESSMASARVALTAWRTAPEKFWALHQRLMTKKGNHDASSIMAAQQKTATAEIKPDAKSQLSVQLNLILSQVLGIQGTPATLIGDQMVAGAIPQADLEALVKEHLEKSDAQ